MGENGKHMALGRVSPKPLRLGVRCGGAGTKGNAAGGGGQCEHLRSGVCRC